MLSHVPLFHESKVATLILAGDWMSKARRKCEYRTDLLPNGKSAALEIS